MTNNQLSENSVNQLLNSVRLARDNAELADNRVDHSFYYALTIALEELQERRKADSEPVAYISKADFDAGYPHILARRDFNKACTMPVYAAQQPAPVVPDDFRDAMSDLLAVLDEYPEQLVPINRDSAVVRACRAALLNGGKS